MSTNLAIPVHPIVLTGRPGQSEDDCACPDGTMSILFTNQTASRFENDCACADMPSSTVIASHEALVYIQTPGTFSQPLPSEFRMAFSPYAPFGPSAMNAAAYERWLSFRKPHLLEQVVDQELLHQNLICPQNASPSIQSTSLSDTLTAWLHITNACNLDCPYCYVNKSSACMSESVGKNAIEKIFETAQKRNFQRVKFKYAGGEATLHFHLVKELCHYAQTIADEKGIALDQVILSNGTNIHEKDADWLSESATKLMISLDATGEYHDHIRHQKNGTGSFTLIENTVDRILLPRGIHPFITITIFRENASYIAAAVRWALARDLPVSLNLYRQRSTSPDTLQAEEKAILDGLRAAYAVFEEILPSRSFINGLLDRVQVEAHSHTCGLGLAYVAITHEGKMAQCQMTLDQPVAETQEGDILTRISRGPIQNLSVENKTLCKECNFRYRCTGGCPLETFRHSSQWDAPTPNCRIYQTMFPEALRLEGLRLMKINGYL